MYNLDNESQGSVVIVQLEDPVTSESGTASRFQVFLSAQPAANVVIGGSGFIKSTDPTEGTITSPFAGNGTLTFTPSNWNVPQVVTVTGQPDDGDAVDTNYTIDLGYITSADPYWDGMYAGSILYINYNEFTKPLTTYVWTAPSAGVFTSITGTGTRISFKESAPALYPADDEGYSEVPMIFHFNYLGKWFNKIIVYTNGVATFDQTIVESWNNALLFSAASPKMAFAPWWDDTYMSPYYYNLANSAIIEMSVYYSTQGVKPNRVFIVEWKNPAIVTDNEYYNFQLRLYEGTNAIEFAYGSFYAQGADATSASIGIKDNVGGANNTFIEGLTGNRILPGSQYNKGGFPVSGTVIKFQ